MKEESLKIQASLTASHLARIVDGLDRDCALRCKPPLNDVVVVRQDVLDRGRQGAHQVRLGDFLLPTPVSCSLPKLAHCKQQKAGSEG
jgi:hypothetical protein